MEKRLIQAPTKEKPKTQWRIYIKLDNFIEDKINYYLNTMLNQFFTSYLEYVCGVAYDIEHKIKEFAEGTKVWCNYRENIFYPLYKYIKQYYEIEETFIPHTQVIEIVERFFIDNYFQCLKFSFENYEQRDKNIDYELKEINRISDTVVIEFLFGEEKHNFKLRVASKSLLNRLKFARMEDSLLRVELLFDRPFRIFKNISSNRLIDVIDRYKNNSHNGADITGYVSLAIDKPLGLDFFKDMLKDDSTQTSVNYYLEDYQEIEVRNKKEIQDFTKMNDYETIRKKSMDDESNKDEYKDYKWYHRGILALMGCLVILATFVIGYMIRQI